VPVFSSENPSWQRPSREAHPLVPSLRPLPMRPWGSKSTAQNWSAQTELYCEGGEGLSKRGS
jgi:hypothetical protein